MTRALILAAGLAFVATAANAQPCLSLSDGAGFTTVSCPDGRSGVLHTDPAGGVSGMIGTQPFQGTALGLDPVGQASGAPSAAYLVAPPPPPLASPPPPVPTAAPDPLAPQVELTQLQREYMAEQQSLRQRRAAASRAAAPAPTTRRAESGR